MNGAIMIAGHFQSSSTGPLGRNPGGRPGAAALDAAMLATPILVVDDEAMIAWMIESLLEEFGFTEIAVAATGEEALRCAGERAPGLLVTDINLGPGLDGIAAAAAIRATTLAPVIFISGYANAEAVDRVRHEVPGAAVLRKPIQVDDLQAAVVEALRPVSRQ